MDPWQLVADGRFADAVDAYTQKLSESPSQPDYRNRATAHLNLGQFDLAKADFEAAEELSEYPGDSNLQSIGVVHWLAGRESDAVAHWEKAVYLLDNNKITYTDAAGGVESPCLLWFAGVRLANTDLQKTAKRSLQRTLRTQRSNCFPGAVGQLVLQEFDAETVRDSVSSVPVLRERQLCQVEFYIAVRALHDDQPSDYLGGLRQCVKLTDALLEDEYYLARYELPRAEREYGV